MGSLKDANLVKDLLRNDGLMKMVVLLDNCLSLFDCVSDQNEEPIKGHNTVYFIPVSKVNLEEQVNVQQLQVCREGRACTSHSSVLA